MSILYYFRQQPIMEKPLGAIALLLFFYNQLQFTNLELKVRLNKLRKTNNIDANFSCK